MADASASNSHPRAETPIRVRYAECDPMGVAHHTAYPVWFEMGRTELLRGTGRSYRDLEDEQVFLAVVSLEVRYRQPARYDDELVLHTSLVEVGHVKIKHEYELKRDACRSGHRKRAGNHALFNRWPHGQDVSWFRNREFVHVLARKRRAGGNDSA